MAWSHPTLHLDVGQFSDPGLQRQNNEDWLGAFRPDDAGRLAEKGALFLVADGMGGHRSGELASRRAVDHVIRGYMDAASNDVASTLLRSIEAANTALYLAIGQGAGQRWGTTLVAAVVRGDQLWIANVGDSRAYLLRDGTLRQLSRDHTLAAELNTVPAENGAGRHLITRALGLKRQVQADVWERPFALRTGDRLLLCSDGLTTPLSDAEIRNVLVRNRPQAAAKALVQAANARGGPDNVSAIVIGLGGPDGAMPERTVGTLLASLARPETWRQAAAKMLHLDSEEEPRWLRQAVVLAALLVILALVGLGLAIGLILFQ